MKGMPPDAWDKPNSTPLIIKNAMSNETDVYKFEYITWIIYEHESNYILPT